LTSDARRGRTLVGGKSNRLIHSASAVAAKPTGRSSRLQPAIMSQTLRKKTKRTGKNVVIKGARRIIERLTFFAMSNQANIVAHEQQRFCSRYGGNIAVT